LIYVLLLILVTAVWGWTFVLVKDAIAQYPTVSFLAVRFALAALVMILVVRRWPNRRTWWVGIPISLALAAGYLLQTVGLQSTSAGNAGLLTGLFVVFTPLLEGVFGVKVPLRSVAAAVLALIGTALLTGSGFSLPRFVDLLVIGCALAFAIQLVMLARWAPGLPSGPLALVQMVISGLVFSVAAAPTIQVPPRSVWFALVLTGVLASAIAFLIQTWALTHLSATRVAVILATEPAWALVAAVVLAGQRLGPVQGIGAALVLLAILGHEALAMRGGPSPAK